MVKKDIIQIFVLFSISISLAFFYNYFSSSGIALFGQWEKSKGVVSPKAKDEIIDDSIEINDPHLMKKIVEKKDRIILDVRDKSSYDEGHIPGALSFPLYEFDDVIENLLELTTRVSLIVVYCSSIECSDSHTFAEQLNDMGFSNVRVYAGGYREWQEMRYEIENNEN